MSNTHFIPFTSVISDDWIPEKFPSPFSESPNVLCKVAVAELQDYLKNPIDWTYDFGLNQPAGSLRIGKMFGVLVVKNQANELGYLAAFSGKLANQNHYQKFVPPVFDSLSENSFLNIGMEELNRINQEIKKLEKMPNWLEANKLLADKQHQAAKEIAAFKLKMKQKKLNRDKQRQASTQDCALEEMDLLNIQLNKESSLNRKAFKQLKRQWKAQLVIAKEHLKETGQEIHRLKAQRKKKSNGLQKQLFDAYQFLNHRGQFKSLTDIFQDTKRVAGAGECAAPKLLQYAFLHHLKPIALAEFWWGKSPKSEIRQHGHFYPPCEEKCRPILGYMLADL